MRNQPERSRLSAESARCLSSREPTSETTRRFAKEKLLMGNENMRHARDILLNHTLRDIAEPVRHLKRARKKK